MVISPRNLRERFGSRHDIGKDAVAGAILGVESVPAGLANGLLAGVNPLSGLYGYLYGTLGGALLTSTPFMVVQATGAMALVVADAGLGTSPDPERALFTLSVLTGIAMVAAGVLRAGRLLRFVPSAVMVGFISAVGVNIVLGQLGDFSGYDAPGEHRLTRTLSLLLHPWKLDIYTLAVGVVTLVLIVWLSRTRLGATGMVVAVAVGSVLAYVLTRNGKGVDDVASLGRIPSSLPGFVWPSLRDVGVLIVPALSLAFVGLVQGAGVSAAYPRSRDEPADVSRDFIGQGAGNLLAGFFQGMPVGGSMSASALVTKAGARSRLALFMAGAVMAVVIVAFSDLVGRVAMPALAGLLIAVGAASVKPAQVRSVVKTGSVQTAVLVITFVLTLLIPLQYAVLFGVALAIMMYVVEESNHLVLKRLLDDGSGQWRESEPPESVPPREVLTLQPYGSLFFASAPVLEQRLPDPSSAQRSVVILRLRGVEQLGLNVMEVLKRYHRQLAAHGSILSLVVSNERTIDQLRTEGVVSQIGEENLHVGTDLLGQTTQRAVIEARAWIEAEAEAVAEGGAASTTRPPTEEGAATGISDGIGSAEVEQGLDDRRRGREARRGDDAVE